MISLVNKRVKTLLQQTQLSRRYVGIMGETSPTRNGQGRKKANADDTEELDREKFLVWSQLGAEGYDKKSFSDQLLNPPCKICGSETHGMLTRTYEFGDEMIGTYNCPVARHDEWDDTSSLWPPSRKYEICQYKLARHLGYDKVKIPNALKDYQTKGSGRLLSRDKLIMMEECLKYLCEENSKIEKTHNEVIAKEG